MMVDGNDYKVKIKISRRSSFKVSISKETINIKAPNHLTREELQKNIEKMKLWAKNKIIENPEKFVRETTKPYYDGQEIIVGKEKYFLRISYGEKNRSTARIEEETIIMNISSGLSDEKKSQHIKELISKCVARKRFPEIKRRIEELNELYCQKDINKITLRHNNSKWGSCSEKGNINISTRILFAPPEVFDYLAIHELTHLIEQNHSKKFWKLIKRAMPNYKEKRGWLKENGHLCQF